MAVPPDTYRANVLAELERALKDGKKGITLNAAQMVQILTLFCELVEAKNDLVRENNALRLAAPVSDCVQ